MIIKTKLNIGDYVYIYNVFTKKETEKKISHILCKKDMIAYFENPYNASVCYDDEIDVGKIDSSYQLYFSSKEKRDKYKVRV